MKNPTYKMLYGAVISLSLLAAACTQSTERAIAPASVVPSLAASTSDHAHKLKPVVTNPKASKAVARMLTDYIACTDAYERLIQQTKLDELAAQRADSLLRVADHMQASLRDAQKNWEFTMAQEQQFAATQSRLDMVR